MYNDKLLQSHSLPHAILDPWELIEALLVCALTCASECMETKMMKDGMAVLIDKRNVTSLFCKGFVTNLKCENTTQLILKWYGRL